MSSETPESMPKLVKASAFPAGRYAVVDPMEVFPEDAWRHIIFTLLQEKSSATVEHTINGSSHLLFVWTTKNGDGIFPLYHAVGHSDGEVTKEFCGNIETGNCLLCIVPFDALPERKSEEHVSYFSGQATPTMFQDGDVRHGDFEVITSNEVTEEYQTQPWPYGDDEDEVIVYTDPRQSTSSGPPGSQGE